MKGDDYMKKFDIIRHVAKKLLKALVPFAKDLIKAFVIAVLVRILFVFLGL